MKTMGEYQVVGRREYRGHKPGTIFTASIESNAAGRAIQRGDIVLLRLVKPELRPGSYRLPDDWIARHTEHTNRGAARPLTR